MKVATAHMAEVPPLHHTSSTNSVLDEDNVATHGMSSSDSSTTTVVPVKSPRIFQVQGMERHFTPNEHAIITISAEFAEQQPLLSTSAAVTTMPPPPPPPHRVFTYQCSVQEGKLCPVVRTAASVQRQSKANGSTRTAAAAAVPTTTTTTAVENIKPKAAMFYGDCFICSGRHHSSNYCPLRQCYACGQYGHSRRVCGLATE